MMKTTLKRRFGGLALGLVVAVGLSTASAAPAAAAYQDCPSPEFCFWRDAYFVTSGVGANYRFFYNYDDAFLGNVYKNTSLSADNSASSAVNNGATDAAKFYGDYWGAGWAIYFPRGTIINNLTGSYNNSASSGYFCSYDPTC